MVQRPSGLRGRRSNLRQPARLRPGAVIGIAAPASPFQPEALRSGVEVLRSMGFDVVVPEGVFARLRHLAGTDAERATLLESLMLDDRVDAVMCARGGYGSLRILPLLDYAGHGRPPEGARSASATSRPCLPRSVTAADGDLPRPGGHHPADGLRKYPCGFAGRPIASERR